MIKLSELKKIEEKIKELKEKFNTTLFFKIDDENQILFYLVNFYKEERYEGKVLTLKRTNYKKLLETDIHSLTNLQSIKLISDRSIIITERNILKKCKNCKYFIVCLNFKPVLYESHLNNMIYNKEAIQKIKKQLKIEFFKCIKNERG